MAIGDDPAALAALNGLRAAEGNLVVLTGAGISTECGVPDFRSPDSPWRVHKPIDYASFVADPAMRTEAWRRKFAMDDLYRHAVPGRGHHALARMADAGQLSAVVTQNIDGLHQAAGLRADRLIELHGNGTYARCLACRTPMTLHAARRMLEASGQAPVCACGGMVKSATVSFGETIDPGIIDAACDVSRRCAVFLVVGSSLVVRPAARLPLLAQRSGATLTIVNREPTALDGIADHVVRADVGTFLATLAGGH